MPQAAEDVENDFEAQIFMGINICRHDPPKFTKYVKMVYKNDPKLNQGKGRKLKELIAKMESLGPLQPVNFDQQNNQAVRENN